MNKYRRIQPRGGSIFAGTITTDLEVIAADRAIKVLTWRDVNGNIERVDEPKNVRDPYNFLPGALIRDGYRPA